MTKLLIIKKCQPKKINTNKSKWKNGKMLYTKLQKCGNLSVKPF